MVISGVVPRGTPSHADVCIKCGWLLNEFKTRNFSKVDAHGVTTASWFLSAWHHDPAVGLSTNVTVVIAMVWRSWLHGVYEWGRAGRICSWATPMTNTTPSCADSWISTVDFKPCVATDVVKTDPCFFTPVTDQLKSVIFVGFENPWLNGRCNVKFYRFPCSNIWRLDMNLLNCDASIESATLFCQLNEGQCDKSFIAQWDFLLFAWRTYQCDMKCGGWNKKERFVFVFIFEFSIFEWQKKWWLIYWVVLYFIAGLTVPIVFWVSASSYSILTWK